MQQANISQLKPITIENMCHREKAFTSAENLFSDTKGDLWLRCDGIITKNPQDETDVRVSILVEKDYESFEQRMVYYVVIYRSHHSWYEAKEVNKGDKPVKKIKSEIT